MLPAASTPSGNVGKSASGNLSQRSTSPKSQSFPLRGGGLDWLLSAHPQQRSYILRYAIGAANCLAALIALQIGARIGVCPHAEVVNALTLVGLLVELVFYVLLRSGINQRFADPSLTEYEINAANAFIAVGYWLATPVGEAIPLVLTIIVLMFGMFATTPQQLGRCCIGAMVSLSTSFVMVARTEPDPIATTQQVFHAALMLVAVPTVYLLGAQLTRIRTRLRERKEELKAALRRIETLATIDMLTGLLNRREMHNVLDRQEKLAVRMEQGFCVCMIDIDFFKKVNDLYGHNMGDEVLRVFASTAKGQLRETDVISRWGGEEFLVMMIDTDITLAKVVLDRMRTAMDSVVVRTTAGQQLTVSFSAGLARYREGELMDHLIERADRALYRAKSEGRNRTVVDRVEAVAHQFSGMAL